MNKKNHYYKQENKKYSKISFYDNIFYWLWNWGDRRNEQAMKEGKNYRVALPERSFSIIAIFQFACIMFFISLVMHTFSKEVIIYLYEIDKRFTIVPLGIIFLILLFINMNIYNEKKYRILKDKYAGMNKEQKMKSKKIFITYTLVNILIAILAVKLWYAYSDKVKQIIDAGM